MSAKEQYRRDDQFEIVSSLRPVYVKTPHSWRIVYLEAELRVRSEKTGNAGGKSMTAATYGTLTASEHESQLRKAIVASTIGTAIEWYDFFFLYGARCDPRSDQKLRHRSVVRRNR